ncbi:hypothetical protein CHS0354_029940 [Potamilus streckersoni]|uniref:Fibronectin type-III domain-containing protein n=1 Tax=Potamilus streckersoni TaxID=2493646 RepID=A0AAE0RT55_9BIVA|nr:hypothetical protein CHS0354_029940 [Potamilus streckersoni]
MGAGASRDGEQIEADQNYVANSQVGDPGSPQARKVAERKASSSGTQSRSSMAHMSKANVSRIAENLEEHVVTVSKLGFSTPEISVSEGQSVIFIWEEQDDSLEVVQVIHDGEKLRPVIGGFSGTCSINKGQYEQFFGLEGEYKFAIAGIRSTPLTVTVKRSKDLLAKITDDGFIPDVIDLEEGQSIRWQWNDCSVPHSVQELKFCLDKAGFKKEADSSGKAVRTVTGHDRKEFARPGLYFFATESAELGKMHYCAVRVTEIAREYRVEVGDRSFNPMILLIEEGDRVWWSWDKNKCKKFHSVYQIEAPSLNHGDEDPYVPVKDGFRWSAPSKQGLLSYEFFKPGVYYYSDQNFQEAAEYIGSIIVKPKQKEQYIELTQEGFQTDLVYAQTGDRIWWTWDAKASLIQNQLFTIKEIDVCLNPTFKKSVSAQEKETYQHLDEESLKVCTKVGMATTHFTTIGVYHYRVNGAPESMNTCSVIVNPGSKNHTIHITDNGFEPKVITVRPNDRVWWVWQSGKKQQNVIQVSHQGATIDKGFCSGMLRDAPSAFTHQFITPGVFYYNSISLPKIFGAVVVSTQPHVHEVQVSSAEIKPDPVTIKQNDIVCWIFKTPRQYDVVEVETVDQVMSGDYQSTNEFPPRRCISKAITRTGVIHYFSKSFSSQKAKEDNFINDVRLSSVISDERYDNAVVRVDKSGFYPSILYIQKGQSLLWTWKGSTDSHNIIHVKSPDSDEPMNVVQGPKAFNSGKPVPGNSFLYTFDEDGNYTVASQGAPGFSCTVVCMDVAVRVKDVFISSEIKSGTVDRFSRVDLATETPGAKIYYTTDGSPAELHNDSLKVYEPEKGVILRNSGLVFVRAVAVKEGRMQSHIFTSRRFYVHGDAEESMSSSASAKGPPFEQKGKASAKAWEWWDCIPTIKACFTDPGTLEVFWDPPERPLMDLIRGYQLFLNGVTYCEMFPATNNSLNISGLAGGRMYDVYVVIYSTRQEYGPQKSNVLKMKCPLTVPGGGPVISLERNDKQDALSIVWMSIDSPARPISGYLVFLNDQQCGKRLVPDPESNRCKVVIGSCDLNKPYKIHVLALPKDEPEDSDKVLMSNILQIVLPLDTTRIQLPPKAELLEEEELYCEYLEVHEGAGYLPAMDEGRRGPDDIVEVEKSKFRDQQLSADDQSVMTDDNEKSTQTKRGRPNDFVPPSLREKGVTGYYPRPPSMSTSETTSETGSETETESDAEVVPSSNRSLVIMDASKSQIVGPGRVGKEKETKTPRTPKSFQSKELRQYKAHLVEMDQDRTLSESTQLQKSDRDGDTYREHGSKRKHASMAIIEVQDTVELDTTKDKQGGESNERHVAVPAQGMGTRKRVDEGEFVHSQGENILPAVSISVTSHGKTSCKVEWELPEKPDPSYRLLLFVVNVVGIKFSRDVNSDLSFECNLYEEGRPSRGVQHCWNVTEEKFKCKVDGLLPGLTYRIYVITNYALAHGQQACEVQTSSSVLYYTPVGPPRPPKIRVVSVDMYSALLEWEALQIQEDLLMGYQIYVDDKQLGKVRDKDVHQMLINKMEPGRTLSVHVKAVIKSTMQESEPSNKILVTCPRRPPQVHISQQPAFKQGCVLIAWEKPKGHTTSFGDEDISNYAIYVDGKLYGDEKANKYGDKHGYQYILNDLSPEQSYDITVKAIAGKKRFHSMEAQHVFCLCDSLMSNVVPVMAPAAPKSPKLRLEGLHPEGIDVTWIHPQQHGDATISGYQMLRDGKVYGGIVPPDVNFFRIRDIYLGDKIKLQLMALTEHPVGRSQEMVMDKEKGTVEPSDRNDLFLGDKYAGCRPGPILNVHYTGLVQPPSQVWCEKFTGHSALIVWSKDDDPKAHFVRPEGYQVTWWPGDQPNEDINSDYTTDDHLFITNLRPATTYTIVVEARRTEKYQDFDENADENYGKETVSAFILTAKSEQLTVKTARPPDPPSNLGVLTSTCSGILLAWDPPREHGVEIIGIRIDAVALNSHDPHHVSLSVLPDATQAKIEGLKEKTDYMVRVTAVTDEYFDKLPDSNRIKFTRELPKDVMIASDTSPWLPNNSIPIKTSGTEPPASLKVYKASTTSLTIRWTPPIVYGTNKLKDLVVRWSDIRQLKKKDGEDLVVASYINLLPTDDTYTIEDLVPGNQYRIIVEAVVSVKTSLHLDSSDSEYEKYRRTAHIMSKPLLTRTRAPTEPPVLLITQYTQDTCHLYWEKPLLMTVVGKDDEGKPKYLRRFLEGYRLDINGKIYRYLAPSSQTCQLTKCKPGRKYSVVLVALTCTEDGKKERKRKYKGFYKNTNPQDLNYEYLLSDDDNLDSSPSEPLEVVLPQNQDGYLQSLSSFFTHNEDRDNRTFGDIKVQWTTQGQHSLLKQFNVVWYNLEDRVIQTKYVSPDFSKCSIPVTKLKTVYNIQVEPIYYTETLAQAPQNVQIMIPGPPDAPEIFLHSSSPEEFVIEWGEPRLYGDVKIRGYQVYLNDKKAGKELTHTHRKAVIPCKPNRTYKVNLVAVSANREYSDSSRSNTLLNDTSLHSPRAGAAEDWSQLDDQEIPVKVVKVTETSIHLDWSSFMETEGIGCYKVQWSSVAQPAEREVKLSNKDNNCVITKCLPGTTHFVRLAVIDKDGNVRERSKQLTIQTSAPPDAPLLSVRACNFRYIAVQWEKPMTYGDALISGYKVYVNGIVEAILNADQQTFTFTHGKYCQEYSFQVQALTAIENLNSKPSDPLVVVWPGVKPPNIRRLPTFSNSSLRVGWDDPYLTEGVKVKHYRVVCSEEDTEKIVQSIAPVHPDTREVEFKSIKPGNYNIYVEVHLYGTSEVTCSDPISLQPAPAPDPPRVTATVVGLEERRQLEKITCDLVNKRDRLIRQVGHKLKQIGALTHPLKAEKDKDVIEAAHTLTRIEELLEECFSALDNFTGQLIAHVSWQCPQSNPDLQLSGFKVLIDGKQYGSPLHDGVRTVRIKLGTEQPMHKLTLVSMTDKPAAVSEESNAVELLTENFRPFSFYCYHSIHKKDTPWPEKGCCKYQDSVEYERHLGKKLANQGLLKKQVPPPACSLLDIFDGEYKPLLGTHKRQYPSAILFWSPWCLPSQKLIGYFSRFAREAAKEYNFIAIACNYNAMSASKRKDLIHMITQNNWREDGALWHCTSQCASSIYEATNNIWKNTPSGKKNIGDPEGEGEIDLTELLGIAGVPTLLFIHPEGHIAWHGRYCPFDYASFTEFMHFTFSEVVGAPIPVHSAFQDDLIIDEDVIEVIMQFANSSNPFKSTIKIPDFRPLSAKEEEINDRIFLKRRQSPKPKTRRGKLTVNQRPYSAHSTTYAYLLKSPYMQKVIPSPRVNRVLMRPASGKNIRMAYETL